MIFRRGFLTLMFHLLLAMLHEANLRRILIEKIMQLIILDLKGILWEIFCTAPGRTC